MASCAVATCRPRSLVRGGYINYYYYGQYLVAVLIKLTGIVPTTAFNLAIPLLFGLTVQRRVFGRRGADRPLVGGRRRGRRTGGARQSGWVCSARWPVSGDARRAAIPPLFDYWRSSRVIPCLGVAPNPNVPCYDTTINEFPYWSFLYADLHAHLIDLPIVVLLIAAAPRCSRGARVFGAQWRSLCRHWRRLRWRSARHGARTPGICRPIGLLVPLVLALYGLLPSSGEGFWLTIDVIRLARCDPQLSSSRRSR